MTTTHSPRPPASSAAGKFNFGRPGADVQPRGSDPAASTEDPSAPSETVPVESTPNATPAGGEAATPTGDRLATPTAEKAAPEQQERAQQGVGARRSAAVQRVAARAPETPRTTTEKPRPPHGIDYTAGGLEPKVKDVGGVISPSLRDALQRTLPKWSSENWEALAAQGMTTPTSSGFREALMRLGLKHIDDPEFISLIPPDGRRKSSRPTP